MQLLIEHVPHVELLTENVNGKKELFLEGPFIQCEAPNRNGRIYKFDHMSRVVEDYKKHKINEGCAWGELEHPAEPKINLDRVSHLITKLEPQGHNFIGKAIIANTEKGNIVRGLLECGGKLGISTRGVGSLKQSGGYKVVQEDFMLATAGDIVANPSAQSAYLSAVMEEAEWLYENGEFIRKEAENARKIIRLTPKRNIEEVALKLFEDIISKL